MIRIRGPYVRFCNRDEAVTPHPTRCITLLSFLEHFRILILTAMLFLPDCSRKRRKELPVRVSIAVIPLAIAISGCGEPTIDASSADALEETTDEVRESLSESQRSEFDSALEELVLSEFDLADAMSADFNPEQAGLDIMAELDGMTGEEVLAEAEQARQERRERERQQALQEIEELKALREEQEAQREKLEQFEVTRSRFYIQEDRFRDKPVIELDVVNNTDEPISRAYFEGVVASSDRSVPWIEETFNYSISGGLEPGEEASWALAPNQFSDWGTTDVPSDAILTVTPYRIDGVDGDPLFQSNVFSERDQQRLQDLKDTYQ